MNKKKIKRATSINDLLTRDDVNGILAWLEKVKPNIQDLIVIYNDNEDGKTHFKTTGETLESLAVWMLETVKLDLMNFEGGED